MTLSRKSAMQARRRRGAVAVIAIVCVVVASVIMLVMVRRAVAEHKCIEDRADLCCRSAAATPSPRAGRLARRSGVAGPCEQAVHDRAAATGQREIAVRG